MTQITKELALGYLKTLEAYNTDEPWQLTDQEIDKFISMAVRNQLDPYKRELHLVKSKKLWKGSYNFKLVTGYDVYLRRADASGEYQGYDTTYEEVTLLGKEDIVCAVTIRRKGWPEPLVHRTFFKEHTAGNRQWENMPRYMHEKVTLTQGLRRAFPLACGGLPYASEELSVETDDAPRTTPAPAPQDPRPAAFQALADAMQASGVNKTTMLGYAKETFGVGSAAELEADQLTQCAEWASRWTAPESPSAKPETKPDEPARASVDTLNLLAEAMKVNGVTVPGLHAQMEKAFGEGNTNPRDRTEDEIADLIQWCDDMGADNEETTTND